MAERKTEANLYWDATEQRFRYVPGYEPKIEHDRCTPEQTAVEIDDEDPFAISGVEYV